MASTSLVRDFTRLRRAQSLLIFAGTMKRATYTSARRTQRRYERDERVRAGRPSPKLDWRCHICEQWFSNYRNRNITHLRHCEKKRAKRIEREEIRRARIAPLPSPDRFSPCSSLDTTPGPVSRSPTRDSPMVRDDDVEQGEHWAKGSNSFKLRSVPEQASGDDESHGEVKIN